MRYTNRTTTLAVLTLVFSSLASASASILGIDYGSEFIKAALVKPGIPIEIVLTKDSRRKEVAAVAFKPKSSTHPANSSPERLYGVDAVNFAARYPDDVYPHLKQLLGVYEANDERVSNYVGRFPNLKLTLAPTAGRSTVEFRSNAAQEGKFALEELIAMQLANVRRSGEALADDGNTITDCVITVPAYFTAEERHAIIAASEIAGMNVMELISDGVAVAVNYAIPRSFAPDAKEEIHIIYDMGASSTTATVVQVRGKTVKEGRSNKNVTDVSALGVGFDRTLGGDAFNQKMYELLLNEFAESKAGKKISEKEGKPIKDLLTGKQVAKLWKEASRVRHILSANTEASSSIESFFPDVDFRSRKIQRSEFEELLKEYIVRISKPIIDSVDKLKGGLEVIDSVIMFGGGVRAPFVQKILTELVGDKLSKNVNGDEAAVMGATFRGASLSKLFRVKDIRVQDVSSYTVGMRYTSEATGKELNQNLFNAPAWRGHSRFVPIKATNDFSFDLYQINGHPLDPAAPKEEIFKVTTTNLTASLAKLKADVNCLENTIIATFDIRVEEKFGLPEVVSADIGCEYDEKKTGIVDDVKGFFGFGKDKDQKVLEDEKSSKSGDSSSTTKTTSSKSKTKSTTATPTPTGENGKPIEKVQVSFTVERSGLTPITSDEFAAAKKKLRVFDEDDTTRAQREEARNNLEAFTYRATELLSSEGFMAVSTEEQREKLQSKINEVSDWIYTREADIADRTILLGKLKELKDLEGPISNRRKEAGERPDGIVRLQTNLKDGKKLLEKMKQAVTKHTSDLESWSSYSTKFVASVSSSEAAASASSASAASASSASAEAEASKSAEAAASASAESSSATDASASPSSSGDPLDNLEDTTSSSSTSTSTTTKKTTKSKPKSTKKPTPTPAPVVLYTEPDCQGFDKALQEAEKWLAEKSKEQEVLKAYEDPTLLSKDLKSKSQKLEKDIKKFSGRTKSNYAPPPPPPPPKKAKTAQTSARKLKEEEARKSLKLEGLAGVEGIDDTVNRMLEGMSDEELDKLIENIQAEDAKKANGETEEQPKIKVERVNPEGASEPEAEKKTEGHDEL
ncbi:lumenal Hsp70 protein [Orbilia oligospora]|uniref:Lumenal Hsp70 protein n=1 Tax=Orbilia oligospora TaxID=2813651 RepID=A0A6G1LV77_ORBOL|nr:lumenal Hsp70 protein [Orbilia oligospora]KAF3204006.1 lumenal Hsp70 protein [Orbilia oligospora]KAF3204144.1 lumenal Hsp70 protein [Orbilia oligospora]KAF3235562.1 lumenal Hsp70 protein [Orbilia oligospora]